MKLLLVVVLTLFVFSVFANDPHDQDVGSITTTSTEVVEISSSDGNYGLMALAGTGLHYDWGVPNKLQLGFGYVFVPGGNQALAAGGATRLGGFLVSVNVLSTVDAPESDDDYAVVFGAVGHF